MATVEITLLNSMAGREIAPALDQHVAWGIRVLDLKDCLFGKGILDLTDEEARLVMMLAQERGLSVYCLSSPLFFDDIERGESHFRERHLGRVARLIALAEILRPRLVRLLAARFSRRECFPDSAAYLRAYHPWLIPLYAEAVDRIRDAGFSPTIENEVHGCIFSAPGEILHFFEALDRPDKCCLTWDAQNLWQQGAYPSLDVYRQLRPLIGYYHIKGGQHEEGGSALRWQSALEDASWPVREITRQVVADGVSPVICLNPSHGAPRPGYDYSDVVQRDVAFLRREIV